MKTAFALALSLAASSALAGAPENLRFYGYAYDLKTNKYLYTEVHEQHIVDDRWVSGTIDYYAPDGQVIGHKSLDFGKDPELPAYHMDQTDMGRVEAITDAGDPIKMMLKLPGKDEKTCDVAKKPNYTADSGFHMFIRNHFAQLMRRETVKFAFVVPAECDHFKFKMYRVEDTTFEDKPAVRIKVEPASLLTFLVDPLIMTYDEKRMELLEFRGISNIHDPKTGKAYVTRIAYYSQPPVDAPKSLPPLGGVEQRFPH
ncbi:MAG TPA: hypothetical protein VFB36_01310 [Nevskiaceae bacterium]|nr:hypothetical protein [Nevskiaceae bacterium]